jgi:hypothetical protein
VLRGGHHEAVLADDRVVGADEVLGRAARGDRPPELGPEADHEVDPAHRHPRLTQRRERRDELVGTALPGEVEFEVGMRRRPGGEDPDLRRDHGPPFPTAGAAPARTFAAAVAGAV